METAGMGLERPDASVGESGRGEVVVARAASRSSSIPDTLNLPQFGGHPR
jgi:hypothetical protein